ncbi:MAG: response regulator [Nitrospirota bacterium]|nr:response regulator [Nitrospirota bacterium]
MKTLIVEDDFISRRILKDILSPHGDCDIAIDGSEAVQAYRLAWEDKKPYELICLDIMMPKLDGQEALVRIRELEKTQGVKSRDEVKVLMISALDTPKNVFASYYQGGATAYLVKPISREKLLEEISKFGLLDRCRTTVKQPA